MFSERQVCSIQSLFTLSMIQSVYYTNLRTTDIYKFINLLPQEPKLCNNFCN